MKNITRHTGKLVDIQRMDSSRNGNPRFSAVVDNQEFVTQVDSKYGYSLENFEAKLVTVTIGSHYGRTTLNSIQLAKA
jgi:hypothetical protein